MQTILQLSLLQHVTVFKPFPQSISIVLNFNPIFQSVTQHIAWEFNSQGASAPVPSCHLLAIASLGARSVPMPEMCSAEYVDGAFFFIVAALSFPMWDVKPTQDYFVPWKILQAQYHRNEQKCKKMFSILVSKVYSSL